eukprot:3750387-Amphidinium_carterae.1
MITCRSASSTSKSPKEVVSKGSRANKHMNNFREQLCTEMVWKCMSSVRSVSYSRKPGFAWGRLTVAVSTVDSTSSSEIVRFEMLRL